MRPHKLLWIARQVKHVHVKRNTNYLRCFSADVAKVWALGCVNPCLNPDPTPNFSQIGRVVPEKWPIK